MDKTKKLTSTQVAYHVGVTKDTLVKWYNFADNGGILETGETLPPFEVVQRGKNITRLWDEKDIPQLVAFKKALPMGRAGLMASVLKKQK